MEGEAELRKGREANVSDPLAHLSSSRNPLNPHPRHPLASDLASTLPRPDWTRCTPSRPERRSSRTRMSETHTSSPRSPTLQTTKKSRPSAPRDLPESSRPLRPSLRQRGLVSAIRGPISRRGGRSRANGNSSSRASKRRRERSATRGSEQLCPVAYASKASLTLPLFP